MGIGPRRQKLSIAFLITCSAVFAAAETHKDFRFPIHPGASISIINEFGPVTVEPTSGSEIVVQTTAASDKVAIDSLQKGNRIELRSRLLEQSSAQDQQVEYQVKVPPDTLLTIRSSDGPLSVQGLSGDVTIEGESAPITASGMKGAHLHIRTVNGPVTLFSVKDAYVDVISVGGTIELRKVTGPRVLVNTSTGDIKYAGDFAGGGTYSFTNHTGNITVSLPASASVDLTARSLEGDVSSDLSFQPKATPPHAFLPGGKIVSGIINSGASSVRLNTFKGSITVSKQ